MPKWRNELSESVEAVGKTLTLSEKVFGLSILPIFCLFFFFMMNTTRSYPYAFSCISSWVMFSLIGIFIGLTFVIPGFTAFEKMIDPLTTGDSMNPDMVPYVQLSALPTRAVSWVMRAGIGMLLAFTVATGFLYFNIYSDDTREDVAIRWTDKRTHVFRASPKGGHSNVN